MDVNIPYKWLPKIDNPKDLKQIALGELPKVCAELRQDIIDELSKNSGHFASSLGAVELTVALHYVFNTPDDRIVWDVGHQAYGHKILTGRRDLFHTNRKYKGIKPFPSPSESEYDSFICGHASNSISAALGMALVAKKKNENKKVVAVIGDGAMSGGLAFEGLNNASVIPNNLLIILNDNDMSIDQSVGGLKHYFQQLHTGKTYNKIRSYLAKSLVQYKIIKERDTKKILRFNNSLKSILFKQQNIFEGLNIRYFGPYDGHNVIELVRILNDIKDLEGPKIIHLHTQKGKGFKPAEEESTIWHAPGLFDKQSGERKQVVKSDTPPLFQDVFGETLVELAQMNDKIVGITPAMPTGCSMNKLMQTFPDRAYDVGIAEGHAVTFSAGLAKEGAIPFCNIYSSFAQRAYDNIIHDAAILNLPVILCLDRAGLVGADGPTHHGAFDIPALRTIPNVTFASPFDECELRNLMYTAQLPNKGLFIIRYPRGNGSRVLWKCKMQEIPIGKGRKLKTGKDLAILSLGPIGKMAEKAIEIAEKKMNISIAHYDLRFIKPLDEALLNEVVANFSHILTIEDGSVAGGVGSAVLEWMNDNGHLLTVKRIGLPDYFVEHGTPQELYHDLKMDVEGIVLHLENLYQAKIKTSSL